MRCPCPQPQDHLKASVSTRQANVPSSCPSPQQKDSSCLLHQWVEQCLSSMLIQLGNEGCKIFVRFLSQDSEPEDFMPKHTLPDFVRQLTLLRALGDYWRKWVDEESRALRLPTDFTMFVGAIRAHVGALALTATSSGLSHRADRVDRKIESVAHATDGIYHSDTPHPTDECNSARAKEARAAASSGVPRRSAVPGQAAC
jgi:hypothetical protein